MALLPGFPGSPQGIAGGRYLDRNLPAHRHCCASAKAASG
ncbi:hypothetical protein DLM_1949 [Aquitalea magnusonii]|uniref:Uncharacterized protein n=1 Tax=Aquitalea magnusonii TaxID=332411 RepID=A0A3G9GDM2_9NEIS|nr:hypothetical protein DLM_1949 [Aquitalea magnusonii]